MAHHITLYTDQSQLNFESTEFLEMKEKIRSHVASLENPTFHRTVVDIDALRHQLEPYQKYKNIIIIGNGGSRTSAFAYWQSLRHLRNDKKVEFLSTMEPDVIQELRSLYNPAETLVMPVSKSGTNVDVLEPLMHFLDYTILPVTSSQGSVLYDIAMQYGWDTITHPDVGGRFSGRSQCAFAPALLMGLDVMAINTAAVESYETFGYHNIDHSNSAFIAAAICHNAELQGKTEIFTPIYSQSIAGFLPLLVQLVHESTGKDGKGQTIFGDQAPESQHHTNQRFFDGRKNVMGWCMTVRHQRHASLVTKIPQDIIDLPLREGTLRDLDRHRLQDALRFDYEGVAENATALEIPYFTLEVDEITPESMGELISFFHYFTVYSSLLRDQNPFDQPAVEQAKDISFQKRKSR